eukprot:jgi/Psemu1/7176/gm1.7176_g
MGAESCDGVEASAAMDPAVTCYKIHSREHLQPLGWWAWITPLLVPAVAVAMGGFVPQERPSEFSASGVALFFFEKHRDDSMIVISCIASAFALLFLWFGYRYCWSTGHQIRDTELSVTVCPLGIQRSKTTTIRTIPSPSGGGATKKKNHRLSTNHRVKVCNYPLLPMESIRDCILLEHVGGFSVSTHVMIRCFDLKAETATSTSTVAAAAASSSTRSELVSAFPDAKLTFDQCHGLVHQIQRALGEMR